MKKKQFSQQEVDDIINAYTNKYKSMQIIAKKYNCSKSVISRVLKENNINNIKRTKFYNNNTHIDLGHSNNIVYMYINAINYKKYIGITSNEEIRKYQHRENYKKKNTTFYNAISKYGYSNFYYKILETNLSREDACKMEINYIEKFNTYYNGYNDTFGGDGGVKIKIEQQTQNHIITDYINNQNFTVNILSKKYNLSNYIITKILKENNVIIRAGRQQKYKPKYKKIKDMHNQGYTYLEISKEINVPTTCISRVVTGYYN